MKYLFFALAFTFASTSQAADFYFCKVQKAGGIDPHYRSFSVTVYPNGQISGTFDTNYASAVPLANGSDKAFRTMVKVWRDAAGIPVIDIAQDGWDHFYLKFRLADASVIGAQRIDSTELIDCLGNRVVPVVVTCNRQNR
jgi:hypothetical protein